MENKLDAVSEIGLT